MCLLRAEICRPVRKAKSTHSAPMFTSSDRDGAVETATAAKRPVQRPTVHVSCGVVASSGTFSPRLKYH